MIKQKNATIFSGDDNKMKYKVRAFSKTLGGVVSNPQSVFTSHLYLFGKDFDQRSKKQDILSIKQFDNNLNMKSFSVTRKEKRDLTKVIKEVSFRRERNRDYFAVLYGDDLLRIIGFQKGRFAQTPIFDESVSLEKSLVKQVTIKSVSKTNTSVEVFFLSNDSIFSLKVQRSTVNRPVFLKKTCGNHFLVSNFHEKNKKMKTILFFTIIPTESEKEEQLLCRHDLNTKQDSFYELSGKCWNLQLVKHFVVTTCRIKGHSRNEHDEVKVIDPINKYVAFRYVPSHFNVMSVMIDHSVILILAEEKEGKKVMKIVREMEDNNKIDKFMKKNCLRLAYDFAENSDFKPKFLAQLSRVSGDKELDKAKYEEAMHHYKNTIGYLEPSYVLQRFIEKGQVVYNIDYLIELHKRKQADQYHIQLLVNCLLEKKRFEELKNWFSELKSKESNFAELAIDACLEYGETGLAKELAQESKRTGFYVQIVIDNFLTIQENSSVEQTTKETAEILNHIRDLKSIKGTLASWKLKKKNILEYGPVLKRYNFKGVLELVKECIDYFLEKSMIAQRDRNSILEDIDLRKIKSTGQSPKLKEEENEDFNIKELLFLYKDFDKRFEIQTEEFIQFLSNRLKKFENEDKTAICEFIIEFYANQYGKILQKVKKAQITSNRRSNLRRQTFRTTKIQNTPGRRGQLDSTNLESLMDNGLGNSKLNNNYLELNRSSPGEEMIMEDLEMLEDFDDKQMNWLILTKIDEETRRKLAHCEAQIREKLDDPEINRLVDLYYLLILFSQCYMREAKLRVYDLLKLKRDKLGDLFFNSDYQECADYCQKNFQDWGIIIIIVLLY